MIRRAGGAFLAGATLLLAACGGCTSSNGSSSSGTDGGGGADVVVEAGPTAIDACTAFATAFCARLEACTPFALQVAYGDVNTCAQRGALLCIPALSANGATVTPTQMEACAQAVQAENCDEVLDNPQPSACDVPGTLPVGAVCGSHAQCQSTYCRLTAGTLCGTCTAHSGAGAQCQLDADCAASLICNGGTCVGPAPLGSTCGATQPCMRSLSCLGGKCQPPGATGASCASAADCDAAHGVYCNTQTNKCAQTQVAATGQPCGIVNGNAIACSGGDSCGKVVNYQGTCHQTAGDNAVCGPDIACLPPAVCISTARCTLPNPTVCH
jgi:hypothetical protein